MTSQLEKTFDLPAITEIKDKLEEMILSETYNNDEEVRNKIEIIFIKLYLEAKNQ